MYYVFDTQLYIVQSHAVTVLVLLLGCVPILEHKSGWKFKLQRVLELKFVCICLTFGQPPRISHAKIPCVSSNSLFY